MPITIGKLTSNVDLVDSGNVLNDEVMELIVRRVMIKLKEEMYYEGLAKEDRKIRDRMSETEPF